MKKSEAKHLFDELYVKFASDNSTVIDLSTDATREHHTETVMMYQKQTSHVHYII